MKIRFLRYLHSSKESNFDLVDRFNDDGLMYVGYEEELVYEYDTETKNVVLIGAGGLFLGDEEINEGELTEINGP